MAYAAYNYTISDASGNIVTGSSVEVRRESDNVLVPLYSDRAGAVSIANPFTDATGTGRFHAAGSAYKVTATLGGFTRTFRYVPIGLSAETDNAVIAVAAGTGISVDATDPTTPSVELTSAVQTSLGKADTAVQAASTTTLTNKRVTPRVTTITSSATPTVNTDNTDIVDITALAAAITSMTTNLTGTPTIGDVLVFQIKDNGTARAITWGASFTAKGVALPTTTVINKLLTVGFLWNGSNWGCVGSAQET
jgi:hypothetical protein